MILGIDIGGTNVKFGIVNDSYNIIKKFSIETPKQKGDKGLIFDIISAASVIYDEFPFTGIGIGSPGKIDTENGICEEARNLPYNNTPVVRMFEDAFNMPVTLENDAKCAVLGELYAGAGKKYNDFIIMTLGTGIGGGIIINKKLYAGASNLAGEIGHMTIKYDGPACKCGNIGCFEMYASVSALIEQTKNSIEKHPDSLLADIASEHITGKTAFEAAKCGCPVGVKVIDTYIGYIAYGIRNILSSLDPQTVILGGAISKEGDDLLIPLKKRIPSIYNASIEISQLGNDAGIIGAASKCFAEVVM